MQVLKNKSLDALKTQQKSLLVEVQAEQMKNQGSIFKKESPKLAEKKFVLEQVTKEIANKEGNTVQKGLIVTAPKQAPTPSVSFAPSPITASPSLMPSFTTAPKLSTSPAPFPLPSVSVMPQFTPPDGSGTSKDVPEVFEEPEVTLIDQITDFAEDNLALLIGIGVVGSYFLFKSK